MILSPGRLVAWINQNEISVTHLTPAMGELLTSDTETICHRNASLRYIFFGGDVLTKQHVARVRQLAPSATCVNVYGTTETPQAIGYFVVPEQGNSAHDRARASSRDIIPLGQGIEDVQLLVLNASQGLAGVGELGEICVRTPYLAQGYLEDDALTQERFISNPFTQLPGDRAYRTGDLGRYLPDGTLEFAGRNDQQVKIRGYRIEPGEIEAVLGQHAAVRETVVVAREESVDAESGAANSQSAIRNPHLSDKRLVAYVVANQDPPPSSGELRRFLKEKLPDYMVPSVFVTLDALPLTPNGKVDRRALPAPNLARPDLEEAFVIPWTPVQEVLAGIWAEVLKLEKVGVHDNFFELGGHSLLATQLISCVRDTFQVELPLRCLFENPTVEELAAVITQNQAEGAGQEELARMLAGVEALSDDEAQRLLADKNP